jgi:hypothetical protein
VRAKKKRAQLAPRPFRVSRRSKVIRLAGAEWTALARNNGRARRRLHPNSLSLRPRSDGTLASWLASWKL